VELIVDVSFHWQIIDVQSMIEKTAMLQGIYAHMHALRSSRRCQTSR